MTLYLHIHSHSSDASDLLIKNSEATVTWNHVASRFRGIKKKDKRNKHGIVGTFEIKYNGKF